MSLRLGNDKLCLIGQIKSLISNNWFCSNGVTEVERYKYNKVLYQLQVLDISDRGYFIMFTRRFISIKLKKNYNPVKLT